ncbi:MAG: rubrerythrin family protein [Leptospirales bacterium]|nr:rubrerythrin family protein [Leptospirales bacterium]
MKSVKGTQTEKNLLEAFAGESMARNRYTFFASKAKKEGYEQIAAIFTESAENEKEHAKRFLSYLEGGEVDVQFTLPAVLIGDTPQNLKAAAMGENAEHTKIYPEAAASAEKEGFPEIAALFKNISSVEKHHEERFLKLLKNIENGSVFKKDKSIQWKCRNCGFIFSGDAAPSSCPACLHPPAYFEELSDNF